MAHFLLQARSFVRYCLLPFLLCCLFTASVRYLSAPVASLFHTLEPVMTALLAFLLLGRILTALQWLGLGLIVVSVTVMQFSALLHSRKTPPVPDRVAAGEAR